MIDINECEKIKIEQGFLYLGPSSKSQSIGYLEFNPKTSLNLHNRPAIEKLTQIKGRCDIIVYKNSQANVVSLEVNDEPLVIPSGAYRIHANPYKETSLTYWDFDGDIMEIINAIKGSRK